MITANNVAKAGNTIVNGSDAFTIRPSATRNTSTKPQVKLDRAVAGDNIGSSLKGAGNAETYYRTMSEENYNALVKTGKLSATRETCISPTERLFAKYDGVLVEFKVKEGTTQS